MTVERERKVYVMYRRNAFLYLGGYNSVNCCELNARIHHSYWLLAGLLGEMPTTVEHCKVLNIYFTE